jgi:hypothetical protein
VPFPVKVKIKGKGKGKGNGRGRPLYTIKIKVKGVGQECPTHTSKVTNTFNGSGQGCPLCIRYANSRPSRSRSKCQASR